jgi:hypothetical protein
VPALRTEVTEIVTGLAMLGFSRLDRALAARPDWFHHVGEAEYDRLESARAAGDLDVEFVTAWDNGRRFLFSDDGLRGRVPTRVEWKGPHKPPGYEQLPADLRVDHVYLISCKYGSNLVHNVSPSSLFDRGLGERKMDPADWYHVVAPEAYQELFDACRASVPAHLPETVDRLEPHHRAALKRELKRSWPDQTATVYRQLAWAVAVASAERWNARLSTKRDREEMLWRLLRLEAAPYFVLGADQRGQPIAFRTATPWDFRDRFDLKAFEVLPEAAGQPVVLWRAAAEDRLDGRIRVTEGHVEVRWSHGRFSGAPEAKVYLDTPHHEVIGYTPLSAD